MMMDDFGYQLLYPSMEIDSKNNSLEQIKARWRFQYVDDDGWLWNKDSYSPGPYILSMLGFDYVK